MLRSDVTLTAEDVARSIKISSRLKLELELVIQFAYDNGFHVYDIQDIQALIDYSLNEKDVRERYGLSSANLRNLMRHLAVAEANGVEIVSYSQYPMLQNTLIRDDFKLKELAYRKLTNSEVDYLNKMSNFTGLLKSGKNNKELNHMASYYLRLSAALWLRDGELNEFIISYGFGIAIEYAQDIMWMLGKLLQANPKNFTDKFSKYIPMEKPQGVPECDIRDLETLIADFDELGNNSFMDAHRRRYGNCGIIRPTEPLDIKGITSKDKGIQFEEYCVSLLERSGFTNISTTKASGDHGVDILAENMDTSYAIQCKYYSGAVGNSAVQEAFSGKAYYDRDIAVVMTNSVFTQQAIDEASKLKVKLWDGNRLRSMQ